MRPLKNPWQVSGKIAIVLGTLFIVVSLVLFMLQAGAGNDADTPLPFVINGAVWLALGLCSYLYGKFICIKLNRLKSQGIPYDAEIINLIPNNLVRIGNNLTVHAECAYRNQEGASCLVKSKSFLLDRLFTKEGLTACVYVNRNNPRDYAVEICRKDDVSRRFDNDYR